MRNALLVAVVLVTAVVAVAVAVTAGDCDSQTAGTAPSSKPEAGAASAQTAVASSNDSRSIFNRACASAAAGERDRAVALFSQAAMGEDELVAARSYYNLGTLDAQQARDLFGNEPAAASPQTREEGLSLLLQALGHYRDSLDLDPQQTDVRINVELIRLWIQRMKEIWTQRDRRDQRRHLDATAMIEQIEADQRELRSRSRALLDQPDSAARRETVCELGAWQQLLAEEMGTLERTLLAEPSVSEASLTDGPGDTSRPPGDEEATDDAMIDLVDDAQETMFEAADDLQQGPLEEAVADQSSAVELLDEIRLSLVPFYRVVNDALRMQRDLIDAVTPMAQQATAPPPREVQDVAWNQQFVVRWCQWLPTQAQQWLHEFQAMSEGEQEGESPPPAPSEGESLLGGLTRCVKVVCRTAPKVHDLASQAAADLNSGKPALALPKQREALALLEQILASFPQGIAQAGRQPHAQTDQDESAHVEPGRLPSSAAIGSVPGAQTQAGWAALPTADITKRLEAQSQGALSAQQAEALMRQVRERQRQRRVLERQFRAAQEQATTVEKDW